MVYFFFLGLVERAEDIAPLGLPLPDPPLFEDFLALRIFFDVALRAIICHLFGGFLRFSLRQTACERPIY
tara:strand:- start:554 stop:763 length:210 start_codon:yes stop_codon:yes gene_type:complete